MVTCNLVLVEVSAADAQVQRLIRLLLSWSFLETGTFPSESQFDNFLELVIAATLAADLYDSLHVATFGSNKPPCHLEFFIIFNLDIETASVLNVFILILRWRLLGATLSCLYWLFVLLLVLILLLIYVLVGELSHWLLTTVSSWRVSITLLWIVVRRLLTDVFLVRINLFLSLTIGWRSSVYPLHLQVCVVLAQEKVVEGLLGEKGGHNIFESHIGESLLGFYGHVPDSSEDLKYLNNLSLANDFTFSISDFTSWKLRWWDTRYWAF